MRIQIAEWCARFASASCAALVIACASPAAAAEPAAVSVQTQTAETSPGLNLLTADSRNEWLHSHAAAAGWTMKDGTLVGNAKSTPLVSAHALGDFELRIDWKVADGAILKLGFPQTPAALPATQAVEIHLAEQPGISIRLPSGAKILKVDPQLLGKLHRTIIQRVGDRLVLDCDGTKSRELPVAAGEKFGLTLAIEGGGVNGRATVESLRLVEASKAAAIP